MAKKRGGRGRRNFKPYLRGALDELLELGTLAAETVISASVQGSVTEKAWITSIKATWSLDDFTPATDDGPIVVGIAHSDYTTVEIEEWLEQFVSWDQGNKVAQEISKRLIRQVGIFESPRGVSATEIAVLNEGKMIHTKCGWQLASGDTVRIWAYNSGSSALATTNPNVRVNGHANMWPN